MESVETVDPLAGDAMTDEEKNLIEYLEKHNDYYAIRKLPNGELAGLQRMLYTTGLFTGLNEVGWRTRFCFEDPAEALASLMNWDGKGFPPGWWIIQKPEDLQNPLRNDVYGQE